MKFEDSKTARLIKNEIPYISFPVFEQFPFIRHGFSTRLGGVSEGIYATMNLSYSRGDDAKCVTKNYERISESIGVDSHSLVASDQVHKTNLKRVGKSDCGKGIYKRRDYSEIDGIYTNEPGVTLVTSYADCVPLLFVDPVKKVIAASHAGWRGTIEKIGPKTVKTMIREYQCDKKDIIVVIGPSICQDCYEVSKDVADQFKAAIDEARHEEMIPNQIDYFKNMKKDLSFANKEKYQLNLWKANEYFLLEEGLDPKNVVISSVCTCCNADLFHSHRASKGQRGGLCAFLEIAESSK